MYASDRLKKLVGPQPGQPSFDSALVELPDTTATIPTTTKFRVGYCELASRPLGPCATGKNVGKPPQL